jgi:hypothetical protein
VSGSDGAAGERLLGNLASTTNFRTNIGAVNPSAEPRTFAIELSDSRGNLLGRTTLSLEAGAQRQWGLTQIFPSASGSGLIARIAPAADGSAPVAYAAVTDNRSSDPTYYAAAPGTPVLFVPGIAAITGIGGALFRSELSIVNTTGAPMGVTVTFLEHDRDNTSAPSSRFLLAPRETLRSTDALNELFGKSETYGALRIAADASPGVAVFERILTDAGSGVGTVGNRWTRCRARRSSARARSSACATTMRSARTWVS